jgi:hypothetical protein
MSPPTASPPASSPPTTVRSPLTSPSTLSTLSCSSAVIPEVRFCFRLDRMSARLGPAPHEPDEPKVDMVRSLYHNTLPQP